MAVSKGNETSELQKAIKIAAESIDKLVPGDGQINPEALKLLKEAVDKLALANKSILREEKAKLENRLVPEAGGSGLKTSMNVSVVRPKIHRQYNLTSKANFEVWLDSLRTELTSHMLLDQIDDRIPKPEGLTEVDKMLRKNYAKEVITSRIDENYYLRVLGLEEPKDILRRLREARKGEVSSTPTSIRTRLYNLRIRDGEKVDAFCERFDQIVREHELSDDPQKIGAEEKRSTFYQAIIGVMPEIRRTDSAVIATTQKEMNMEELRKAMYRIQQDNDSNPEAKAPKAAKAQFQRSNGKAGKCYRCNKIGHWKGECPYKDTNEWFCYSCNKLTDHHSNICPYYDNPPISYPDNFVPNNSRGGGPPAKRFKRDHQGPSTSGLNQNRGRGSPRGQLRGNFRGRRGRGGPQRNNRGGTARRTQEQDDYYQNSVHNDESEEDYGDDIGKSFSDSNLNNKMHVEFIADSGATEHFVNKSFILSDFKVSKNGVIKSANKNDFADIVIDGRGNLLLKNNTNSGDEIKLTNVIAAKDLSENLLSLRKIVDAGSNVTLNNKIFRVYNKANNKTIFEGTYERPNWVVKFEVSKISQEGNVNVNECDNYSCNAFISNKYEFQEQSRTLKIDNKLSNSEGENSEGLGNSIRGESMIGRENVEELIDKNKSENSEGIISEEGDNLTSFKIINIDELVGFEHLKDLIVENTLEKTEVIEKQSEALLWYVRLGRASLNYLKILRKKVKILEHIKFDESIKDCEVCILSKMERIPFK